MPWYLSDLAMSHAELAQFDEARRCIGEAMTAIETSEERWYEAEFNRIAGEIILRAPEPNAAKAQAYFEHALVVARGQQAKSWELRAAMSMARLWRDQGKPQQARELLAPVYRWFTEGFDTLDLKVSIGVGSGPQIGIQKGPPRFAFRTISARAVGAGRDCGDGASAW